MSIYDELGIKTYINAMGTISMVGGSRMSPEALEAMADANRYYVDIPEMHAKVGEAIAKLTRNEAAYVTNGASAGLLLSTAVCISGGDEQRLTQLPKNLEGIQYEVIGLLPQKVPYAPAIEVAGGTWVWVGQEDFEYKCTEAQLEAAFTDKTGAAVYFARGDLWRGGISLERFCEICHSHGVPVIVDAAAQVPPVDKLWHFTQECGADLAVFSGGKNLNGPQASGLVVGKKKYIDSFKYISAPKHGVARSSKVSREEVMALYVAIKQYVAKDPAAAKELTRTRAQYYIDKLGASGLYSGDFQYPGGVGEDYYRCQVTILGDFVAEDLRDALKAGEPGVLIGNNSQGKHFTLNTTNITQEEMDIVIAQVIGLGRKLHEKNQK